MKRIALALGLCVGVASANQPPPGVCELTPERCPRLTKLERVKFGKLARTLERLLPTKQPYKRTVYKHGPEPTGYGRRGSAFPTILIVQGIYYTDPDPTTYTDQGRITFTPLPVASFHHKGGTLVADRPGWLVYQHVPHHHPTMVVYDIVVGQRAGEGIPQQYPPTDAPDPPGIVRSIHIGVLGPPDLAKDLLDRLDAKQLLALVDLKR